jgi:hypothetical protein
MRPRHSTPVTLRSVYVVTVRVVHVAVHNTFIRLHVQLTIECPFAVHQILASVHAGRALLWHEIKCKAVVRPRTELDAVKSISVDEMSFKQITFIKQVWLSNGNQVMSILHVPRKMPGGIQLTGSYPVIATIETLHF